jgi:hypothetical protein
MAPFFKSASKPPPARLERLAQYGLFEIVDSRQPVLISARPLLRAS